MFVFCRRSVFILALLGGATLALSGCGQKGPLYMVDDREEEPQPIELSEQELRDLQDEMAEKPQTPRRTTDEALKTGTYGGSLFPDDPRK